MEQTEPMEQTPEILTTGAAAAFCGVSRSTLRRAVAQGHLRAWHTPGKHLRFTREACEQFASSLLGRYDLVGHGYQGDESQSGDGATRVDAIEAHP